jgi:hypothetical protein
MRYGIIALVLIPLLAWLAVGHDSKPSAHGVIIVSGR